MGADTLDHMLCHALLAAFCCGSRTTNSMTISKAQLVSSSVRLADTASPACRKIRSKPNRLVACSGVDFKVKMMDVESKRIKMTIWDTGTSFGGERSGRGRPSDRCHPVVS